MNPPKYIYEIKTKCIVMQNGYLCVKYESQFKSYKCLHTKENLLHRAKYK